MRMGVITPDPAMQDLKLTFHESSLVSSIHPTPNRSFFLSNIDQMLNYNIPTVYFFANNPDYPPPVAAANLKLALQKLLVPYDFMAGRLNINPDSGRLQIHCNGAGAGFVVASSALSLEQIGDLVRPSLGFRHLAVQTIKNDPNPDPMFILQITSFTCGGFAIGLCVNHILLDGMSAKSFNQNLASQAFPDDRPLAVLPCFDRRLLAARSPPRVAFDHPEFFKPDLPGPPVFDCEREELEYRVFQFDPDHVALLKEKALQSQEAGRISSLTVVAALIWKCKALSSKDKGEGSSTLLNVMDLRARLQPALPPDYCGNALLVAYARGRCGELEFWEMAKMVGEGPSRVTDEYAKSAIDWLEMNKGVPCGDYMVSSWLRLGFEDVVFPWGKALHCGPLISHRKDICWLFPTTTPNGNGNGPCIINALVSLPPPEMDRFQTIFTNFFS